MVCEDVEEVLLGAVLSDLQRRIPAMFGKNLVERIAPWTAAFGLDCWILC